MGTMIAAAAADRPLRVPHHRLADIAEIRINAEKVRVIEVSDRELLMECAAWVRVGRTIRLKVVIVEASQYIVGRVSSCEVTALSKEAISYRVAVALETPLNLGVAATGSDPMALVLGTGVSGLAGCCDSLLALNEW